MLDMHFPNNLKLANAKLSFSQRQVAVHVLWFLTTKVSEALNCHGNLRGSQDKSTPYADDIWPEHDTQEQAKCQSHQTNKPS